MSALCLLLLLTFGRFGAAQETTSKTDESTSAPPISVVTRDPVTVKSVPKNLLLDQRDFWTAPLHMSEKSLEWAIPSIVAGAALIYSDQTLEKHVPTSPSTVSRATSASNAGVAVLAGAGAGMFLLGHMHSNDQQRETGILGGEAAIDAFLDTEVFKYAAGRERPFTGTSPGRFFVGGTSFPSEHAAVSWAIASVIAHEYPGPLTKILAYGAAGGVSAARFAGQKHFFSDVVVGSALGWYLGWQVYRSHSRYSDADSARYGSFYKREEMEEAEPAHRTRNVGSAYVPLESWIYPAIERLTALGFIQTTSLSLRPWTRIECARLLTEAADRGAATDASEEVQEIYGSLNDEFAYENGVMDGDRNRNVQLESIYSRFTGISGTPLTDNFHFGQTVLNDYGRPYENGFNNVSGASGWGVMGPLVAYVRGEYQSAPSAPAPSQAELTFFNSVDGVPTGPAVSVASINRFRLLDTYVGLNFANWQFSFGRHSLWWGPSEGGTLIFSNNAAPLNNMVTVDRVTPVRLPWLFRYLGDIRFQAFIGHMSGQEFLSTVYSNVKVHEIIGQYGLNLHPQPFLSGGKISLKLTPNFEFSMAKTTIYGGPGNPLTVKTFVDSTFGVHVNGDVLGDSRSSADFSYRLPGLRNWVTAYGEALSEDEISPIPYMRKSAFQGGLYLAKVPNISKMDLRIEGGSTSPVGYCAVCMYSNAQYISGYNNDGRLIGTWIGRASQGELMRSNYWLTPRSKIGVEVRHRNIDRQYLPQGGTQNDVAVNAQILTRGGFGVSGNVQYERWQIPLLAGSRQSDVSASFEFSFWPKGHGN